MKKLAKANDRGPDRDLGLLPAARSACRNEEQAKAWSWDREEALLVVALFSKMKPDRVGLFEGLYGAQVNAT